MTDAVLDPETEELVIQARSLRFMYELGRDPDEVGPALALARRADFLKVLKGRKDPATGESLNAGFVWAAFEPDERGLVEVLFTTSTTPQQRLVAWVNPDSRELVYVAEGW